MTIKSMSKKKILAFCLAAVMVMGLLPINVLAIGNNEVSEPVETWEYSPLSRADALATEGGISASDTVRVHVTATNKNTLSKENVVGATVRLFVDDAQRGSATTDSDGYATLSLAGLTLEERYRATISADKVISRGKAINGTGRDSLYEKYYPKEDGEYYRYTMELHSETIDENGNWVGVALPDAAATEKVDMVFAIDATGSMSNEINNVKTNLAAFSEYLVDKGLDIRFCVIDYRDITCSEVTNVHTISGSQWLTDLDDVITTLSSLRVTGGGDGPETPIDALGYVADNERMKWRSDAHRFAFVLTDADYKTDNNYGYASMEAVASKLAALDVVTSVITDSYNSSTYRNLYSTTGGIYADIYASDFKSEMITLSDSIAESVTRDVDLVLSEPRLLVNFSVGYFANDKTSKSEEYKDAIKDMLDVYSKTLAQATDGHVYLDKVVLLQTNNRLDFYKTNTDVSKCDLRIETEVNDDGKYHKNVIIHNNAHTNGFFSSDTITVSQSYMDRFQNLKNPEAFVGKETYVRILSGGQDLYGNSMIDDPYSFARTQAHETGHYLLGLFDEYMNANTTSWNASYNFGMMDWQASDIELSKRIADYAYVTSTTPMTNQTFHWYVLGGSTEDTVADLLTSGTNKYDSSKNGYYYYEALPSDGVFANTGKYEEYGRYLITYTKSETKDRHAEYSYAGIDSADYLNSPDVYREELLASDSIFSSATLSDITLTEEVTSFGYDDYTEFAIIGKAGYSYSIWARRADDADFVNYETINVAGMLMAKLPVKTNEIAEIRILAEKDGESLYNTYYLDRSDLTDVGYLYTSVDNKVMAYVMNSEETSYTFIADNNSYTNGEYVSVNQATSITVNGDVAIDGGEIYSVASFRAEIDYTTLSWFCYRFGEWIQLPTDLSEEESMNIGARADVDGEGLYVLMAKKAPVSDSVFAAQDISYVQATDKDAIVTLSFTDKNANSRYYNVYYSDSAFTDKNADGVLVRSYGADSTDLVLDLVERGRSVYAAIEIVLEDGTRSPLSELVRLEAGEADSDGDGIPDWYCDKYGLWGKDGEYKDIAGSDDDGDGLTNLQEYKGGSDPTNPNDPAHTTNVPVTSVNASVTNVALAIGGSVTVTATVTPDNATNKSVVWTVENPGVASILATDNVCKITGLSGGETKVYVVTADGGYSAVINVSVGAGARMAGDLNRDGSVTITDAVLLAQYLASWDIVVDEFCADCDGDGAVNARDAVLLSQFLAGWNVTLG